MQKVCKQTKKQSLKIIGSSNEELKNQIETCIKSLLLDEGLERYVNSNSDNQLYQFLLSRKKAEGRFLKKALTNDRIIYADNKSKDDAHYNNLEKVSEIQTLKVLSCI